jgi:hypothetical protein
MADFARWGTAITWAAGYNKNAFMDALNENSQRQVGEVLQSDMIADAIKRLLSTRDSWQGSPMRLLDRLTGLMGDAARGVGRPKTPNHLSRRLNALITPMRAVGIEIEMGRSTTGRVVSLRKTK